MQSTALTTFLQDSKNANLNIQSAVCGQLNNIPFDSSLVINGRRPSVMGIEKSNGMMVVISNWLSHPNLSPRLTDDVWPGPRWIPGIARRHPLMSTPAVFSGWWSSRSKFLKQAAWSQAGRQPYLQIFNLSVPAATRVTQRAACSISLRVCRPILHLDCIISCQQW